ncbi:MAG TPA: histidine--tRNA ligase [Candidatus Limiplasma sp.]|nr:histidine--tRNA ligase [Candidatus Limiplasma sp.]
MLTRIPKGTKDVLPSESPRLQAVEALMREKARLAGYAEIRTPVFEHTELFARSAGETSDVVRKEMYTFLDKGGRSITLKPESTAGVVRAFIESGLYAQALPLKVYYLYAPHFRYEAPQAGRLREHHQFGMECFGAPQASADAELILTAVSVLESLGLKGVALRINSIGCPNCRPAYQQKLRDYLHTKADRLCKDCVERTETNPLRVLDCKNPECQKELADAPRMLDDLCDDCKNHFEDLKRFLDASETPFVIDTGIVRGLDYYTKTVFELTTDTPGGTLTACGGGRYDKLVEQVGGPSIPAVGFGMGMERVLMLLDQLAQEDQKLPIPSNAPDVFVASLNREFAVNAFELTLALRKAGLKADMDHAARSLKAQFKYADKLGAVYVAILGEDEVAKRVVKLRNMNTKEEQEISLAAAPETIRSLILKPVEEE